MKPAILLLVLGLAACGAVEGPPMTWGEAANADALERDTGTPAVPVAVVPVERLGVSE